ncbi:hypothetical protein EVAR_37112_1 [Eumeta japonica]|uniref:Uncharacterized protein n=1 Tax=Eumeta variegata TaxID=151549 RepID=A0A4C1XRT0_EUMVA|nr:hypothetical protein EVAR_37112_1 [Eumeta japonica]
MVRKPSKILCNKMTPPRITNGQFRENQFVNLSERWVSLFRERRAGGAAGRPTASVHPDASLPTSALLSL